MNDAAPVDQSSSSDSSDRAVLVKSTELRRLVKLSELCVNALSMVASGPQLQLAWKTRVELLDAGKSTAFKLRSGLRRLAGEQAQASAGPFQGQSTSEGDHHG